MSEQKRTDLFTNFQALLKLGSTIEVFCRHEANNETSVTVSVRGDGGRGSSISKTEATAFLAWCALQKAHGDSPPAAGEKALMIQVDEIIMPGETYVFEPAGSAVRYRRFISLSGFEQLLDRRSQSRLELLEETQK